MHNRDKHKDRDKYKEIHKPLLSNKQKKMIRNYGVLLLTILLIAAFFYWRSMPLKNAPVIEIEPSSYSFGVVSQSQGVVSTTIPLVNTGSRDLVITGMDSSCGCTSASLVYEGVEGPRFSMSVHGSNPRDWEQVIPPGKTAQLKIYYDPNVHRELRGIVTRSIFVFSNDQRHPNKEVKVTVNQIA